MHTIFWERWNCRDRVNLCLPELKMGEDLTIKWVDVGINGITLNLACDSYNLWLLCMHI
jgi:hypothetical protein